MEAQGVFLCNTPKYEMTEWGEWIRLEGQKSFENPYEAKGA